MSCTDHKKCKNSGKECDRCTNRSSYISQDDWFEEKVVKPMSQDEDFIETEKAKTQARIMRNFMMTHPEKLLKYLRKGKKL